MKKTITQLRKWFACVCLLGVIPASAQVATTYTFSQAAGTYTAISGGTVLANAASSNMDDEVFGPVTIPSFSFDGRTYTSIYINTNGFITFGAASQTTEYEALSSTDTYPGAVSAFSQDLDMASGGARNIRYQLVGSEAIVQWQNVARYAVTGERISFQIRLDTATNKIKIVYGGTITPGSDTDYMEVGLRGPDNTFATNVNNRKINAGTGAWINSVPGTNNGSTCYFNSATAGTVPAAGLTYTWTPAPVDMRAEALVSPGTSGCYGTAETVSVTVRNTGGAAIDFSVTPLTVNASVTGPDPVSFSPVTVNTGTLAINASQPVVITTTYDMSAHGTYTFSASTSVTGDSHPLNDMMTDMRDSHTPSVMYASAATCSGQGVTLSGTATAYPYNVTVSNMTSLSIPDDDPTGVNSTITITGAGTTPASSVVATIISLPHTFMGDLILTLTAPDGSSIVLSNQEGDDGSGYANTSFSASAATPISAGSAPYTGTFLPEEAFSGLTGSANGTWTLNISDNAAIDVGTLNGWSLGVALGNTITAYNWTPSATLSSATTDSPVASPTASTIYAVTVTDASGCSSTASDTVNVNSLPTVIATADVTTVCENSMVTLNGAGADTYTWDNSVTNNSAFAPAATTMYHVTGTDMNGCMNTDSILITVNPLPGVMAVASAAAVCEGGTETLTGSGASSYTWDNSVSDGMAFVPAATATYHVTGTDINGCVNTDSVTVTVNPLPVVAASADMTTVCEGSMVTLNGSGADTYTWDNGVTDGMAFAASATSMYHVTGVDTNGCMNMDSVMVTVNPLPAVAASADMTTVCEGGMVTLTGGGADTYTWDNSVTDGTPFAPAATSTYHVTGTDASGCMNTDSVMVTVNPLPLVDVTFATTTYCVYTTAFTLSGESPAGGTWSGNGVTGNTFDPSAAGAGTSVITYMYTDANGCTASDTASLIVDLCTGIASNAAGTTIEMTAYPNPANESLTLSLTNLTSAEVTLQMTDMLGQLVYSQVVNAGGSGLTTQIDVSSFTKGTYLLSVNTGKAVKMLRIMKQ